MSHPFPVRLPGLALLPWLAAAWLSGGCELDPGPDPVVGTLERERIELRADSDEPLIALHVTEGDRVETGEVLAEQDPRAARAALAEARARAEAAAAALDEVLAGPRLERVRALRARLEGARSDLALAETELRRARGLAAEGFLSEALLDQREGAAEAARAQRDALVAELDELIAGARSEVVARLREQARAAREAVVAAELGLERTRITAPVEGTVEVLPFERGERPPRGSTLVALLADGRLYARVHIPEPLRARLAPGMEAAIHVDGEPEPRSGRIHWIASEAAFTPFYALTRHDRSRLAFPAEIDLDEPEGLPVGLPVEVTFPALGPGS